MNRCMGLAAGASMACVAAMVAPAVACQYTVRDIGFILYDPAEYSLMMQWREGNDSTDSPSPQAVRRLTRGTNLTFRATPLSVSFGMPQLSRAGASAVAALHIERPWVNDWFELDDTAVASSESTLEQLIPELGSPEVASLKSSLVDAFAVVIVIEPAGASVNDAVIDGAMAPLVAEHGKLQRGEQSLLGKPMPGPATVLRVAPESPVARLVGAAGIADRTAWMASGESAVAVVYGRGRLAGPVMIGASITSEAIGRQLLRVGEDCECTSDYAWVNEPSLLMRWTAEDMQLVATRVGFNPSSPIVRREAESIVARGMRTPLDAAAGMGALARGEQQVLLGYSDIPLSAPTVPTAQTTPTRPAEPTAGRSATPDEGAFFAEPPTEAEASAEASREPAAHSPARTLRAGSVAATPRANVWAAVVGALVVMLVAMIGARSVATRGDRP